MSVPEIPYPFDPDEFRKEGHKLVDTLSDYLNYSLRGNEIKVLPWQEPDVLAEQFSFDSGDGEKESLDAFFRRIIENSIHIHHPHYIGHQVTSPLPATALAQLCTSLLNNGAAIYEMGPVNMAMERNVINRIGSLIGYKPGYDGIFTHGGTAGNLTAMLAARQNITEYNIWEEGIRENNKPGYMVSSQAHYSVGRNVKIMGLGADSVIQVPADSSFKMNTSLLDELKEKAEKDGNKVIAVVASACSTATGSYDNLDEIAGFCTKHKLWLHVDGAHGMGVLFSEKYRSLVKGIERADSIVIDFHKMFLVPALNTLVMFKNSGSSYETFAQKASYLFQKTQSNLWYESAIRTIECTKSALGIIAYTALKYYGKSYFSEYINSRYDLARTFAGIIETDNDFELAVKPESNIVCFRFIGNGLSGEMADRFNLFARESIMKEGSFYIVKAELGGKIWIRVTIINPMTSAGDLKNLLIRIKEAADHFSI